MGSICDGLGLMEFSELLDLQLFPLTLSFTVAFRFTLSLLRHGNFFRFLRADRRSGDVKRIALSAGCRFQTAAELLLPSCVAREMRLVVETNFVCVSIQ